MALTTVAHTRTISIVVPAFNEARRITGTLDILCDYLRRSSWDWEVRVVDDGSSDDTARLASAVAMTEPRIVVQREPHGGKGAAVKAGLCAARGAYRFMCDADLSVSVDQIERFLPLGGPSGEVVIATRGRRGPACG